MNNFSVVLYDTSVPSCVSFYFFHGYTESTERQRAGYKVSFFNSLNKLIFNKQLFTKKM